MSSSKPTRPDSAHRHGSSFMSKLHRRHDARHHTEQQPLIQSVDDVETSPEPETEQPPQHQNRFATLKSFLCKATGAASRLSDVVGNKTKSAVNIVKDNPKTSLALLAAITTAVSIGETAEIIRVHHQPSQPSICNTPECIYAANMILRNMHPEAVVSSSAETSSVQVDPCKDFNEYACGGFENQYLSEGHHVLSGTTIVSDSIINEILHILEVDDSKAGSTGSPRDEIRKAFTACKNITAIRENGINPLKTLAQNIQKHLETDHVALRRTFSIPMMRDISLTPAVLYAMDIGLSPFTSISASPLQDFILVNPVIPRSVSQIKSSGRSAAYKIMAQQTLRHIIDEPPRNTSLSLHVWNTGEESSFERSVDKMIQLEFSLYDMATKYPPITFASATAANISIKEADQTVEKLSLSAIADDMTNSRARSIILPSKDYLENLAILMSDLSKEVVHMYLVWSAVKQYAEHVESDHLLTWKSFMQHIDYRYGEFYRHQRSSPGRLCVSQLNANLDDTRLGWMLSKLWLEKEQAKSHEVVSKVVKAIREAFQSGLERHVSAKRILEHMRVSILDTSNLPDLSIMYEGLMLGSNHFENALAIARWEHRWSKTHEWTPPPSLPETHYSLWNNEVQIPSAVLRKPFAYGYSVPSYLHYGSTGSIIGHQMTRAFGSSHAVHIYHSNDVLPPPLWSNETQKELTKKEQCFSKQYASLGMDSDSSVDQAIADAEGARMSFKAWKKSTNGMTLPKLPGLERYTSEQLFWLAFASKECSKLGHHSKAKIDTDKSVHGIPGPIRIKGAVANNVGFLEAFKCPQKEPVCSWL